MGDAAQTVSPDEIIVVSVWTLDGKDLQKSWDNLRCNGCYGWLLSMKHSSPRLVEHYRVGQVVMINRGTKTKGAGNIELCMTICAVRMHIPI